MMVSWWEPKPSKRKCAICGGSPPRERMVYSRHTKRYFCGESLKAACDRRKKRVAKAAQLAPAAALWAAAFTVVAKGWTL